MATEDLCFLTIQQLADAIRWRHVSPIEVVQAHLSRCERLNGTLNAFVTLAPEATLQAAREAESEIVAGHYRGALPGVPIGVKDIFDTTGIRTTYGSSFYCDHVPTRDAAAVTLLKQAGAIVLGKGNTHEFAAGSTMNHPTPAWRQCPPHA
jgi:aspartyl-tRNA(Asn)/glutamyl-tRNA(Gln) amidotransferase subunit A